MKKKNFLLEILGLAYVIDRLSKRKEEPKEPELTMELKYTPGPPREPVKFEDPKDILCPYCNYRFEEMLKRSRKCPECKKYIYRKKNYENKVYQLITEEQYEKEAEENIKETQLTVEADPKESTEYARLLRYQEAGFSGVRISTSCDSRVCPACAKQQKKFYSIEDALKQMPLPCKDCTSGYCRCCYIVEVEGIDFFNL